MPSVWQESPGIGSSQPPLIRGAEDVTVCLRYVATCPSNSCSTKGFVSHMSFPFLSQMESERCWSSEIIVYSEFIWSRAASLSGLYDVDLKAHIAAFWVLLCQVNLLSRKNMSALFPARNCCWDLIDNCVSRLLPTLFLFSLIPVFSVGLCGTKLGCGEGGCGACTVMISKYDPFQKKIMYPLQSGLWQSVKWNGDSSRILTYHCFKRCYIMYASAKTSFFIFRI